MAKHAVGVAARGQQATRLVPELARAAVATAPVAVEVAERLVCGLFRRLFVVFAFAVVVVVVGGRRAVCKVASSTKVAVATQKVATRRA